MEFIHRKKEIAILRSIRDRSRTEPCWPILTVRRRIGKTSLVMNELRNVVKRDAKRINLDLLAKKRDVLHEKSWLESEKGFLPWSLPCRHVGHRTVRSVLEKGTFNLDSSFEFSCRAAEIAEYAEIASKTASFRPKRIRGDRKEIYPNG